MCHLDNTKGDASVPRQTCTACHAEQEILDAYDDQPLVHTKHVTENKVECFRCHTEIRHGKDVAAEGSTESCLRCHTGDRSSVALMYKGIGGQNVDDQPSAMSAASVNCIACHTDEGPANLSHPGGKKHIAGEAGCIVCHGNDMEGTLESWTEEAQDLRAAAQKAMDQAKATIAKMPESPAREKAQKLYAEAEHNFGLVSRGNPAHNLGYAESLLENISQNAELIKTLSVIK